MGFGVMFFGYLIAFGFSLYFFADITAVLGGIVMLFASLKLAEYNRYFNGVIVALMALSVLSLGDFLLSLFDAAPVGILALALSCAKFLAAATVHILGFLGIRGISLGASCGKLVRAATRNAVMTATYYVISIAIALAEHWNKAVPESFVLWIRLYWIICVVLNLWLFYQSFGLLCPADEDPTKKKHSRFRLLNYMDEKIDKFEENKQNYRLESVQMALKEAERRSKEREKKHPNGSSKKKKKK